MGQYKVPQNVEAEDKIIGPLTLKQFLYAVVGLAYGGITYLILQKIIVVWVLIGVPPALLLLMLGLYQRQDQPFETYLISLIGFLAKPRKRIWHKDPLAEVFHIEPPKLAPQEAHRDPREVLGELEKLSQVVDTRGWSAKEPNIQEPTVTESFAASDRIVEPSIPKLTDSDIASDVNLSDDILDFRNNPSAQNLNRLIADSSQHLREEALGKMEKAEKLKPKVKANSASVSEMTDNPLAGILKSAMENEELTVSQLAAQVNRTAALAEGQAITLRDASKPTNPTK